MRQRLGSRSWLQGVHSLLALLVLVVVFSILADGFFRVENVWTVARQISVNLCLSVGMTLVILTGGIDLSVGSILALSGALTAGLLTSGWACAPLNLFVRCSVFGAVLGGLLVGGGLGACNGWMIVRFRVPPFVATLAMLTMARGLTELYTGGEPITNLGEGFARLGSGTLLGVPNQVWVALLTVAAAAILLRRTGWGRSVYAVGGNEEAARLSGLNVQRIKLTVYTLAGSLAAVGGLIVTSRLNAATPVAGEGYELDSIAAVVIGGTSLAGGRGSVGGTVLGALIIGVLNSGLVTMGVDPYWQKVIKGLVILLAVIVDRWRTDA